jgi:hypothetical protein
MEILQLSIVGAIVSVIVQFLKNSTSSKFLGPRTYAIALSLVAGTAYWLLKDNIVLWQAVAGIAVVANAVYGFLISALEQ